MGNQFAHEFLRSVTGTAYSINGDMHAYCDYYSAPVGQLAERLGYITGLIPSVAMNILLGGTPEMVYSLIGMRSIARKPGVTMSIYTAGAGDIAVNGFATRNYTASVGDLGFAVVDGTAGLVLDGTGATGSEIFTGFPSMITINANGTVSTSVSNILCTCTTNGLYGATGGVSVPANSVYAVTFTWSGNSNNKTIGFDFGDTGGTIGSAASGSVTKTMRTTGAGGLNLYISAGLIGETFNFTAVSVKQITGIHASQPTAANRPTERRGLLNLLTYSHQLDHANWLKSNVTVAANQDTAPDGTLTADLVYPSLTGNDRGAYQTNALGAVVATYAVSIKQAGFTNTALGKFSGSGYAAWFNLATGAVTNIDAAYSASIAVQANGYYLCVVSGTGAATSYFEAILSDAAASVTATVNGTNGVYIAQQGLFKGTLTAQQILDAGGIPLTAATAASNATAGRYSLEFNGANNSLLIGNVGFTNAATIVIAGRVNSLSAVYQVLLAEDNTGVNVYIDSSGTLYFGKTGASTLVSGAGAVVAGVPFVLSVRLGSGIAVIRKNGLQIATAATALLFSATTGARIGHDFTAAVYPLNGSISQIILLPQALSDADCLVSERAAATTLLNGPSF